VLCCCVRAVANKMAGRPEKHLPLIRFTLLCLKMVSLPFQLPTNILGSLFRSLYEGPRSGEIELEIPLNHTKMVYQCV